MKTTRSQIAKYFNPFSKERVTLFDVIAKGDADKEKKLVLTTLRIMHILCLSTIPAAITGLIFTLSSRNFVTNDTLPGANIAGTVFLYLISLIMVFIGYRNLKISRWFAKQINNMNIHQVEWVYPPEYHDYMWVILTHIFRTFMFFGITVLFGYIAGMINDNIYPAIPLFILATVALILTYPTNRRLDEYLRKQESTI